MADVLRYFYSAFAVTALGIAIAGALGWHAHLGSSGSAGALSAISLCLVLGLLEVSLSFDNALINATIIRRMNDVWRRRFLTWGLFIAVFGMRLVFPLAIVGLVAWVNPWSALVLAVEDPRKYAEIMHSVHVPVVGFGGMFLLMVALAHFLDPEKDAHWMSLIERPAARLGRVPFVETGLGLATMVAIGSVLFSTHPDALRPFIVAGLVGIFSHMALDRLNHWLENGPGAGRGGADGHAASAALFLYLEVQDASFSFDGVVGAFAITNNLFIIAIGLGVGAMFVRSLTLLLVDRQTLGRYRYIETGAFYAIGALALTMLAGTVTEVPDIVPGGLSALLIVLSFVSSIRFNRAALKKPEEQRR